MHSSHYKYAILAEFSSPRTLTVQNINTTTVFSAMKRVTALSATKSTKVLIGNDYCIFNVCNIS